jgi:hypothetical protein
MRKFHIALGVVSLSDSIADYTQRLGAQPQVMVPGEYALWRTEALNISIRQVPAGDVPGLRHLGWEESTVSSFTETRDCNGILWEEFSAEQQLKEILALWPEAEVRG